MKLPATRAPSKTARKPTLPEIVVEDREESLIRCAECHHTRFQIAALVQTPCGTCREVMLPFRCLGCGLLICGRGHKLKDTGNRGTRPS